MWHGAGMAQVLELPVNLHELSADKQCEWVRKQHRKLARRWHPDKYSNLYGDLACFTNFAIILMRTAVFVSADVINNV